MRIIQPNSSVIAGMGVLVLMTQGALADPVRHYRPEPAPPRVSVDFLVAGRPLPKESSHRGRTFVAVPRWGVEYEIRICNHESRDRVLFVIGVDGLSVMDGSHVSPNSGGYVLDPGESTRVRGWRRGHHRVAAFTFTSPEDSYAGRAGHRSHIGEVWVQAVREKNHRPPVIVPHRERASKSQSDEASEKAHGKRRHSARDTGTGYGDELVDHVRPTHFIRSNAVRRLNFRYGLRPVVKPCRDPGESFTPAPPGWQESRLREVGR